MGFSAVVSNYPAAAAASILWPVVRRVKMQLRFSLTAIYCMIFVGVVAAPRALAQGGPDIFVTPIPDAPFSAVIQVQRTIVFPDGGGNSLKTTRGIGRDSRGRIYNESRMLLPLANTAPPQLLGIHLYDPQTRISTRLDPHTRTYWTGTVNRPPETMPPALLASPAGTNLPQNHFVKEEDLGVHEIDGVSAHGVRETQTISAESSGTGKEVVISDEYWYSQDLRINLSIKHSDPRTGSVAMTVTQIARTDPDPSRFAIPEDYKPAGQPQQAAQ
jgi:hypothetical protein